MNISREYAVFLFAHQDDEAGVFQQIDEAKRKGYQTECIYFTNGVKKGEDPLIRNKESINVLRKFNLKENEIIFAGEMLGINDGKLHCHLKEAKHWLKNYLKEKEKIKLIIVPAWEGGHHDHDTLHALTVIVTEELGLMSSVKQFPYYNGYKCSGQLFRVMKPIPENGEIEKINIKWKDRLRYLRYCLSYPSQITTWIGLFPFMVWHFIFYDEQYLQRVSRERVLQRPHRGLLYYERRKFYKYDELILEINEINKF